MSSSPGEEEESLGLAHYLQVARKYWLVIGLISAAGVAATVVYTLRQPKIYEATAAVVIDPQPPQVFGNQVQEVITLGTGSFWSNQEYYNTQVEVLSGFDLAMMTIADHGLQDAPALGGAEGPSDGEEKKILRATRRFKDGLSAKHKGDSRIVELKVQLRDPDLAVRLANLHVATFLKHTLGLRSGGTGKVSRFLASELDRAEKRLRTSEKALLKFIEKNDLLTASLEEKQSILAQNITRYTTALADVRIERTELGATLKRAKNLLEENAIDSPLFALVESAGVAELRVQYEKESRRLRELGAQFGPKHPEYRAQNEKVQSIVGSLQRNARRVVREVEEKFEATRAAESRLSAQLARLKSEAMELEPKTVKYNELKRKQARDAESYDIVHKRLRTSNLTGRNEAINIRSHTAARNAIQVSPNMALNVAAATVLFLLLGLGVALLLDYMDRTIKTSEQVEATVGAPVLGVIPIVAGGGHSRTNPEETKSRDLHVYNNPASSVAECCRAIRTNILFASTDKRLKTLTVSSPRPREGKSTSSIYLGTTMAQSGQRVLLIDADLRKPRLHKAMEVSREHGLTTVLLGETKLEDAIKPTKVPNLYVLPAGPQPPNPAELLVTEAFSNLLKQLEGQFDRILIDSPPLLAVSDAVVLSRLCDGVVLVVQAGQSRIDDAKVGVHALRSVDASIVGVILNDINLEDRRYGYGSGYHGYTYGYSEEAAASS